MANPKIRQTPVTTLKMLNNLYVEIGKNPNFNLNNFLKNNQFRNHQYRTLLINNKIVKNIGGPARGQIWKWLLDGEPTMKVAIKYIEDFKALNRNYSDNSFEKRKTDEIKVLTENAGTLFEPKKTVLENDKWKCVPEVVKISKEEIENSDFNKLKDVTERLSEKNDIDGVVTPNTANTAPPKIVEKEKLVYKYQLKISDGNLAFQFALFWGLIKINFVYRGRP